VVNNYRGQRVDTKEWVYGNLLKLETDYFTDSNDTGFMWYIIPSKTNGSIRKSDLMLKFISPCFEVIPETVGQSTGRMDWYEGDILDLSFYFVKSKGIIRYGEYEQVNKYSDNFPFKNIGFYIETKDTTCRVDLGFFDKAVKISTIHDNPELLQEVENVQDYLQGKEVRES
jgi:hypothetical protein